MHSMRPLSMLAEHEPHQVQVQIQQQMQHDEQSANMTVLESLNPSQPQQTAQQVGIGSSADQQQQQRQVSNLSLPNLMGDQTHLVQQHLVQSGGLDQQPHLHQLQPSHGAANAAQALEAAAQSQQMLAAQSQSSANDESQQQQHQRQTNQVNLLRQRPQIEGIVAEGGGPIVQWLLDNYEIADGESLPRSTVYNHYLAHCRQLQMASVNAASFGKLIRSVFVGLKTRRLGTRGHSKYHYFGVRAKQHIQQELIQHQEQTNAGCSRETCNSSSSMLHQNNENSNQTGGESESDSTGNGPLECGRLSSGSSVNKRLKRVQMASSHSNGGELVQRRHQQQQQQHQIYHQQQQAANDQLKLDRVQHQVKLEQQQQQQQANGAYHHVTGSGYQTLHHSSSNSSSNNNNTNGNNNNHTNGFNNGSSPDKGQMINSTSGDEQAISMGEQHCELADFRNHLGANWATLVDEHWPQREPTFSIEQQQLLKTMSGNADFANLLDLFEIKYKIYYKRMVELLSELKFLEVEQVWMEFWQADSNSANQQHEDQDQQRQQEADHQQWCATGEPQNQVSTNQRNGDVHHRHHDHHHHQQQQQQQQQQHSDSDIVHQQQQHLDYQQQQPLKMQPVNLVFHQLYQLTNSPAVVERINQIDYSLFAAIESLLLPDMLSPIPFPLAQRIRLFAKNFGPWIELATKDYDPRFAAEKSKSARAFGNALRRYTSLNYLSTASHAIWEKRSSLAQMSMDLSRVDLRDIEHQVSLMSRGDGGGGGTASSLNNGAPELASARHLLTADNVASSSGPGSNGNHPTSTSQSNEEAQQAAENNNENNLLHHRNHHLNHNIDNNNGDHQHHNNDNQQHQAGYSHHPHHLCAMQPAQLIQNFLHLLEDPYPANSWPDWCRNLVESRVCGLSIEEARNFLLNWNFYISLIMKELTLRSAPSFSSFQLIRLLFDDYIFYLVVTRLAQAQHKTFARLLAM